jgi:hypothetical protein
LLHSGPMWGDAAMATPTAAEGAMTPLPAVTSARAVAVAVLLGASPH